MHLSIPPYIVYSIQIQYCNAEIRQLKTKPHRDSHNVMYRPTCIALTFFTEHSL